MDDITTTALLILVPTLLFLFIIIPRTYRLLQRDTKTVSLKCAAFFGIFFFPVAVQLMRILPINSIESIANLVMLFWGVLGLFYAQYWEIVAKKRLKGGYFSKSFAARTVVMILLFPYLSNAYLIGFLVG